MDQFKQRFTRIEGRFSQARRMPRLGRIRLGLKKKSLKTGNEYPTETEGFVVPPEVAAVYGENPKELDVLLPAEDPELVFPQSLSWYGSSAGLKCRGNGRIAERLDEASGVWKERTCPCEHLKSDENPKGDCTEQAHLMVILPRVSMGGTYQITTRSFHSVVTINSALDYIKALVGRIALIPLKLRREPRETHHDGKKQTHHTLALVLDASLEQVGQLRQDAARVLMLPPPQLEPPEDKNPQSDEVDEVVDDTATVDAATLADMTDAQLDQVHQALAAKRGDARALRQEDGAPKPVGGPAGPGGNVPGTQQPSDAPAPAALPIDDKTWKAFVRYLDEDEARAHLKAEVRERFRVKNLFDLKGDDRRAFYHTLIDAARQADVPIGFDL